MLAVASSIFNTAALIYRNIKVKNANSRECKKFLSLVAVTVEAITPLMDKNETEQKKYMAALQSLNDCLTECNTFITKVDAQGNFTRFVFAADHQPKFVYFNNRLTQCITLLNLSVNIQQSSDDDISMEKIDARFNVLDRTFGQISAQLKAQTALMQRLEARLNDNSHASVELRALKETQNVQNDVLKRIEKATHIDIRQQQQMIQSEQLQTDLLQNIQHDLQAMSKKTGVKPKDILIIQHEQALILSLLEDLKRELLAKPSVAASGLPNHTLYKNHTDEAAAKLLLDKGIEAKKQEKHLLAIDYFKQAAELGNRETVAELLLNAGIEAKKQNEHLVAFDYFKGSAELSNIAAKVHYGMYLLKGKEGFITANPQAAFIPLNEAAKAQHPIALITVARMYEKGNGVDQNIQTAKELYKIAELSTDTEVVKEAQRKRVQLLTM